jgi:hypothetical protein
MCTWSSSTRESSRWSRILIWGVQPAMRTELQRLQSFNHGKRAPKMPLAVLDELWNIDKHRYLHLTHFQVWLHDIRSVRPWSFAPELKLRIVEKHSPGPFKGRTEMGRVEQVGPHRNPLLRVYVEPDVAFDVTFEQGPPTYGEGVLEMLKPLFDTAVAVLVKFDS